MRVILDTNIWVSALVSRTGAPAKIVNAVLAGKLVPVFSEATFAELEDVLGRPKLKRYFDKAGFAPADFLVELRKLATFAKPRKLRNPAIRDNKDIAFVELASARSAAEFLVTGDADFTEQRYSNTRLVAASEFAKLVLTEHK